VALCSWRRAEDEMSRRWGMGRDRMGMGVPLPSDYGGWGAS